MTREAAELAGELARYLGEAGGGLTIDGDAHISDPEALPPQLAEAHGLRPRLFSRPSDFAGDLIREMDLAGVDLALCWQNPPPQATVKTPAATRPACWPPTATSLKSAMRHRRRIIPAGWTDPKACGPRQRAGHRGRLRARVPLRLREAERGAERVPHRQPGSGAGDRPDRGIGRDSGVPFRRGHSLHARPRGSSASPSAIRITPILAIHMGGGGAGYCEADALYAAARALGLRRPNIRYVLSALRDTHAESSLISYQLAGEPYRHNLCCGSDAPYGRMAWNFGGYRAMLAGLADGARHTDARLRAAPGPVSARGPRGTIWAAISPGSPPPDTPGSGRHAASGAGAARFCCCCC